MLLIQHNDSCAVTYVIVNVLLSCLHAYAWSLCMNLH